MSGRAARAAFLVLGAVVVTMAALTVWPSEEASEEGSARGKTSLPSRVTVEEAPDSLDAYRGGSDVDGPADDGWREVALGFARDLASHDGDHAAWHRRASRWVTLLLAEAYLHADLRMLPRSEPVSVRTVATGVGLVEALVDYADGSALSLRIERTGEGSAWLISFAVEGDWRSPQGG